MTTTNSWFPVKDGDRVLIRAWSGMFPLGEPFEIVIEKVNGYHSTFLVDGFLRMCGNYTVLQILP